MDPTENEQEVETQDPGMVEVHEASIEDLDSALANAQAEEANALSETEESESVAPQQEVESSGQQTKVAAPQADPSKPRTYTEDEIRGITAENERLRAKEQERELFIKHRGNELGTLRQQFEVERREKLALKAQLESGLEDRFAENPVQASNDRDRIKDLTKDLEAIDNKEERASRIVEAQTFFLRNVDINQVTLDDVADLLKHEDGIEDGYIAAFKSNPWEFTTPEALVQMGKRAMDRKKFVSADSDRRVLARHVLYLNAELEKFKKRPQQVMAQVQRNLNRPPDVSARSSASPKAVREIDPTRMSIPELDAALKAATQH